ncbi:MAG: aminotransferase class V-fold PLP-dependent enzyme [Rhodobacteraceae bacterium]|nr:aminotransferase class V-fold PLP-dependent enzyme [Paracoccaceae bacterium]
MTPDRIYLDWNATAPLAAAARAAVHHALDTVGNPSSIHTEGRQARAIVDQARQDLADAVGADPMEVTFTSGATESAALTLAGRDLQSAAIEHDCISAWTHTTLSVDTVGRVTVPDPARSCLQAANGETGVLQTLPSGIAVSDATQAFGKIPLRAARDAASQLLLSAHKIGGPKGVGAIVGQLDEDGHFRIRGGGQEFGRRSGTENIAGIAGFGAASRMAAAQVRDGIWQELQALRDRLEVLLQEVAGTVVLIGAGPERLPNTTCFALPGWKGSTQVIEMDLAGYAISAGSACASGKVAPSSALRAMRVPDEIAECSVRISLGPGIIWPQLEAFATEWGRKSRRRVQEAGAAGASP